MTDNCCFYCGDHLDGIIPYVVSLGDLLYYEFCSHNCMREAVIHWYLEDL
jgi:hypothetical protein